MTPIHQIIVEESLIFTEDTTGNKYQQGQGTSPDNAEWMGWSLARAHAVPLKVIRTVAAPPVVGSSPNLGPEPGRGHGLRPSLIEEVDRAARAYGFEIGRGQALKETVETSLDNPFMNNAWRDAIKKD
jgi:hypothetical protein